MVRFVIRINVGMRSHTYTKFSPAMADAVDLQGLLDNLADFLLQSGFAGGSQFHPFWGETGDDADHSLRWCSSRHDPRRADQERAVHAPKCSKRSVGDASDDLLGTKLAEMLDSIVKRLIEEGYLNLDKPPEMPAGHQNVTGPGGLAQAAARDVQFNLTDKGVDFLGYKALRGILSLARQGHFRLARHRVSRHRNRVGWLEQAVRVRRRPQPRRDRNIWRRRMLCAEMAISTCRSTSTPFFIFLATLHGAPV